MSSHDTEQQRKAEAFKEKLEREIRDEFLTLLGDLKDEIELQELEAETHRVLRRSALTLGRHFKRSSEPK